MALAAQEAEAQPSTSRRCAQEGAGGLLLPMRPTATQKGAPSPGEDLRSVHKALKRFVDTKGRVGATDSALALLSGFAAEGMLCLGACRYLDEMTPFQAVKKKTSHTSKREP